MSKKNFLIGKALLALSSILAFYFAHIEAPVDFPHLSAVLIPYFSGVFLAGKEVYKLWRRK